MPQELIARLPLSARDYLHSFDLAAVAVSPTGKVYVTGDPYGAALAWWTVSRDARRVASEAKAHGDVVKAARLLGVKLTEHGKVLERTLERTAKLEEALRLAQMSGLLSWFNGAYRHKRLEAARAGMNYPNYQTMRRRLHAAIVATIANGGVVDRNLFAGVFEPSKPTPKGLEPLLESPAAAQN
jgi:hypothetical protein